MAADSSAAANIKWYYRPVTIVIAILFVGPLGLPLVWMSPSLKRWHKILFTLVTLALTVLTIKASADLFNLIMKEMKDLQSVIQ